MHRNKFLYNKTNQMLQFPIFVYSFGAGPGCNSSWSCSKAIYKPVWHIPLLSVQWINSWWWAEELSETCRVSCKSKFGKLVHLVGFIIKKNILVVFLVPNVYCIQHFIIPIWSFRKPEINFYPYSQLNVSQQHVLTRNILYYRLNFFQLSNLENVYV
jgi:hypothetical protein